eukprot:972033-Amorphochlora_amoeboformis.AAC.1
MIDFHGALVSLIAFSHALIFLSVHCLGAPGVGCEEDEAVCVDVVESFLRGGPNACSVLNLAFGVLISEEEDLGLDFWVDSVVLISVQSSMI